MLNLDTRLGYECGGCWGLGYTWFVSVEVCGVPKIVIGSIICGSAVWLPYSFELDFSNVYKNCVAKLYCAEWDVQKFG